MYTGVSAIDIKYYNKIIIIKLLFIDIINFIVHHNSLKEDGVYLFREKTIKLLFFLGKHTL